MLSTHADEPLALAQERARALRDEAARYRRRPTWTARLALAASLRSAAAR